MTAGASSAASAPDAGCGPMGGPGRRGGGRWGRDDTPGWPLMTPQERIEHRDRMVGFTSYEDCHAYADQHHQQMAERAKQRGLAAPPAPRRDACAQLKPGAKR